MQSSDIMESYYLFLNLESYIFFPDLSFILKSFLGLPAEKEIQWKLLFSCILVHL